MNPPKSASISPEPEVGVLRVVNGTRVEHVVHDGQGAHPSHPAKAVRSRDTEQLFVLLGLVGDAPETAYQGLVDLVTQVYWATGGSITAALREATARANRLLFRANVSAPHTDRFYANLVCAVVSGDDLFVLQVGSTWGAILKGPYLQTLPRTDRLPPLGIAAVARVHLSHSGISPHCRLLFTSPAWAEPPDLHLVARALQAEALDDVLSQLLQVRPVSNLTALVVRRDRHPESPVAHEGARARRTLPRIIRRSDARKAEAAAAAEKQTVSQPRRAPPPPAPSVAPPPRAAPAAAAMAPRNAAAQAPRPPVVSLLGRTGEAQKAEVAATAQPPLRAAPSAGPPRPDAGERLGGAAHAVGRGLASAGAATGRGAKRFFWRMMPGAAEPPAERRQRGPRQAPQENRALMMGLSIAIPLVLLITVLLAYRGFGAGARFETLMNQAREQADQALALERDPEAARLRWGSVLTITAQAAELRPSDTGLADLQHQAQAALDELDHIQRLEPLQLYDFGPMRNDLPRQLVVRGQTIFVLDPGHGWLAQMELNQAGDGLVQSGSLPVIVSARQLIGGSAVRGLVDCVWVSAEGGRQSSALVMLEEGNSLLSYDPAWGGEGGTPQVVRLPLGGTHTGTLRSMNTYEGRVYFLEREANQIWRYTPVADTYPEGPDAYFAAAPPLSLSGARDVAIDGNVYVLYEDGSILKFLTGQLAPFEVRGVPEGLSGAVALAADPGGASDVIYVADQGGSRCTGRVVVLGTDGLFRKQFCADEAFTSLEAVAFDIPAGRLFVVSGGRLYVARTA